MYKKLMSLVLISSSFACTGWTQDSFELGEKISDIDLTLNIPHHLMPEHAREKVSSLCPEGLLALVSYNMSEAIKIFNQLMETATDVSDTYKWGTKKGHIPNVPELLLRAPLYPLIGKALLKRCHTFRIVKITSESPV